MPDCGARPAIEWVAPHHIERGFGVNRLEP